MAIDEVWEQVKGLNQYIEESKPWELAKLNDEEHLREVLAYCASSLLEIASLLAPFMPDTSEKIRQIFASGILKEMPPPLFPKFDTKPAAQQ
jgi:methionyl-tRNA synthetase